jgi:hypothetical protein
VISHGLHALEPFFADALRGKGIGPLESSQVSLRRGS